MTGNNPLYSKAAADHLREREKARKKADREKYDLLLGYLTPCRRLVDVGCGWGQFLAMTGNRADFLYGVDESPDRVAPLREAAPEASLILSRACNLGFANGVFDVAVASQVLHEVVLFGQRGEFIRTLVEIGRVLGKGGRLLLLDHMDAGDGEVRVSLSKGASKLLALFESRFTYREASHFHEVDGSFRLPRRDLQDFLTKDWSLGSPMEGIEMGETHNVFRREKTIEALEKAGFHVVRWIPFASIDEDLRRCASERISGDSWFRKFLVVAEKA